MQQSLKNLYLLLLFTFVVELNAQTNTFPTSGDVGIGTISPLTNLHIDGGRVNDLIWPLIVNNRFNGSSITNYGVGLKLKLSRNDENSKWGGIAIIQESSYANHTGLAFYANETEHMRLSSNGNLGIGTKTPGSYKLAVNGKIRAKEIKVETGWADYVFKEDYDLPTLEEVERHIKEKGHLIHIPSASEVEKNGIQLGEMNKLLLEKIEELTLYIIQQEKKIKVQNKANQQLEERMQFLEALVLSMK